PAGRRGGAPGARGARGRPRPGARRLRDRGGRPHRRTCVVSFTGERLPAADADFAVDRERHLAAYRFARAHAARRAVLDAGSGEGYGAALLAEGAVRVAAARHRAPGLEFRAHELERLGALGERFDLVVSFQVIEHVRDPLGFLRALARCGGALVVTTPNRLMSVSENPYHLREWTA